MNTHTWATALGSGLATRVRWSVSRCASSVLDLLYPLTCVGCGVTGWGVWCPECDARVARLAPEQRCRSLAMDAAWENSMLVVASGAHYEPPLREAIHALKYDGTPDLAGPLTPLLLDAWQSMSQTIGILVPVPLHARRLRERGYNQSELLSRRLSARCGIPVEAGLLRRVRYTRQQAQLPGSERKHNVQGAFAAAPEAQNKHIALVDDVFTSGSTLVECAKALLSAGAASVCALTLARA